VEGSVVIREINFRGSRVRISPCFGGKFELKNVAQLKLSQLYNFVKEKAIRGRQKEATIFYRNLMWVVLFRYN
jgi:hypothetical protein